MKQRCPHSGHVRRQRSFPGELTSRSQGASHDDVLFLFDGSAGDTETREEQETEMLRGKVVLCLMVAFKRQNSYEIT